MESITLAESKQLIQCERVIKDSFFSAGEALMTIRDKKLYRADFDSFEEYCLEKWGYTRQRGYQLIESWKTLNSLPEKCQPLVDNERQMRALAQIPEEKREAVLKKIEKSGEDITAKSIGAAAPKPRPSPPVKAPEIIHKDKIGRVIPRDVVPIWLRAQEIQDLMTMVSKVKGTVCLAQDDKDILFASMNFSATIADLTNAHTNIKTQLPYAVCPYCQGLNKAKCRACNTRGMVGKWAWDSFPKEITAIVLKGIKK